MGAVSSVISNLMDALGALGSIDCRALILGLDAAGKTTMLNQLKLGETMSTVPTIGFNCERVEYKKCNFTCWDIGGQDKIRRLWNHYLRGSNLLIWIVDATDADRFQESHDELKKLLACSELDDARLLVYVNKQDLPHAMSPSEVADKLGLYSMRRAWHCQGLTATTGDGLYEGLDWAVKALKEK